ncbi:MAG: chromosomal replication initiator protein DnaA [Microscillaceae bacterium]|nr:chromosomal replication initiator protein DnaA [Microscillaceae bacterium]MDW8460971.1 chromosomal replication initiator protein DnaA [Cytophagales bacterium]
MLDSSASEHRTSPSTYSQPTSVNNHEDNNFPSQSADKEERDTTLPETSQKSPTVMHEHEEINENLFLFEFTADVNTLPDTELTTEANTHNGDNEEAKPTNLENETAQLQTIELDHATVWERCLRYIRKHISNKDYNLWLEPVKSFRLDNACLIVTIPNRAFYDWIEENCSQFIREALDLIIGEHAKLRYRIEKPISTELPINKYPYNKNLLQIPYQSSKEAAILIEKNEYWKHLQGDFQLNPDYTFENFIEGDCNRMARNAAYAIVEKPGKTSFNPFMIYGGVGLGKTHLLHAIGNAVQRYMEDKRVIYISIDKFTNQFIDALKNNKLHLFSEFYTQIDILLLDDIQYLAGKDKMQEMFFNIFNTLKQCSKQIVMTSDRPPAELEGLQDRLISRFKSGLITDLQQPDLETRLAILRKKIQNENIFIPDEVIEYLANAIDTNIRELEGAMITLMAQTSLTGQVPTLAMAKKVAQEIVQTSQDSKRISIDDIQLIVSEHFNLTIQELKDKTRKKEIVTARQIAMYLAKKYTEFSLKSIGYHFGGRDHSTVIHAIQCVEEMLAQSREMRAHIEHLSKILAEK